MKRAVILHCVNIPASNHIYVTMIEDIDWLPLFIIYLVIHTCLSKRYEYILLLIRLTSLSKGLKVTLLGSVNVFNDYNTVARKRRSVERVYNAIS